MKRKERHSYKLTYTNVFHSNVWFAIIVISSSLSLSLAYALFCCWYTFLVFHRFECGKRANVMNEYNKVFRFNVALKITLIVFTFFIWYLQLCVGSFHVYLPHENNLKLISSISRDSVEAEWIQCVDVVNV